jgi:hypothetical protein
LDILSVFELVTVWVGALPNSVLAAGAPSTGFGMTEAIKSRMEETSNDDIDVKAGIKMQRRGKEGEGFIADRKGEEREK